MILGGTCEEKNETNENTGDGAVSGIPAAVAVNIARRSRSELIAWANPRGCADRALRADAPRASRRRGVSAHAGDDPFRL